MIQSMTGYGKAEALLKGGKLTIEIRTLNSKSADINIKSSLLPKEKDIEVRKRLSDSLVRGTIDLFLTFEATGGDTAHTINAEDACCQDAPHAGILEEGLGEDGFIVKGLDCAFPPLLRSCMFVSPR